MEEFLRMLVTAFLYCLYIVLIPVALIVATPFILIWPGKKRANGSRARRPIGSRYARLFRIWKNIGLGLPIL